MKNFETLYKILMNEAEYEDLPELEGAEDTLGGEENPLGSLDDPRQTQINNIRELIKDLSEEEARKLVADALNKTEGEEDLPVEADDLPELEEEDFYAGEDDYPDIPAYDSQMRQNARESEL
jgi:hypothetical protein